MKIIRTPDTGQHRVETDAEKQAFINGFKAALRCYGIYKDGQQRIGCMETPIVDVFWQLDKDNP